MIETLSRNWWLLALSGVLEAIYSASNFFNLRGFVHRGTIAQMGMLAMAAGACTIAAGLWNSRKGKPWLLLLNGLACSALGLTLTFWTGRLAFRTIALLIIVMAVSIGIYELSTAPTLRSHLAGKWLLAAAGIASLGFALAFLAFVFHWIELDPRSPTESLLWLGSYFGFSAISKLGLALRPHKPSPSQPDRWKDLPAFENPKPAH